ncbi:MAG: methyl-accepting chemotaxis protein [Methanosarcinales archaeon]|nr:methyl-accepting chemotaxis protein [Methanosarcinales archaeon]
MNNSDDDSTKFDFDELISQEDRNHLLDGLHRYLVWVGEVIPEKIIIDNHEIKLRDITWKLINEKRLIPHEKKCIRGLIHSLEQKEKLDEEQIETAKLTKAQAEQIHDEAAGLLRAIMDLRDLEEGRINKVEFNEVSTRDKVQDARRWVNFVKQMKK